MDGHVIPHHVLFTHATPDTTEFETLAFGDNVKVIISFSTVMNGKDEISEYDLSFGILFLNMSEILFNGSWGLVNNIK